AAGVGDVPGPKIGAPRREGDGADGVLRGGGGGGQVDGDAFLGIIQCGGQLQLGGFGLIDDGVVDAAVGQAADLGEAAGGVGDWVAGAEPMAVAEVGGVGGQVDVGGGVEGLGGRGDRVEGVAAAKARAQADRPPEVGTCRRIGQLQLGGGHDDGIVDLPTLQTADVCAGGAEIVVDDRLPRREPGLVAGVYGGVGDVAAVEVIAFVAA